MTENKRFELAYEKGNWWAVRDGGITLWKEEVVELLNKLNNENKNLKQALWEAEEEYLHEAYHDNPIRLQDKIMNLKEDWDKEYWND